MLLHRMALNEGGDGGETNVGQLITVNFSTGQVMDWGTDRFAEAARRCSAEALRQPPEIARTLQRCAARYLKAAERGGS